MRSYTLQILPHLMYHAKESVAPKQKENNKAHNSKKDTYEFLVQHQIKNSFRACQTL